jgi:hypothetical protein
MGDLTGIDRYPAPVDVDLDTVVHDALAAIGRGDWNVLRPLLHPYLHWTDADGNRRRGRTVVLAHLKAAAATTPPAACALRDGQIYRWVSRPKNLTMASEASGPRLSV